MKRKSKKQRAAYKNKMQKLGLWIEKETQEGSASSLSMPPSVEHSHKDQNESNEFELNCDSELGDDTESNPEVEAVIETQSIHPGNIQLQPATKIVFNAPYDFHQTCHIKLINSSAHRIAYSVKAPERLGINPPFEILEAHETAYVTVTCQETICIQEDTNNDRITFEWRTTQEDGGFSRDRFQGDGMFCRKSLRIEYNK